MDKSGRRALSSNLAAVTAALGSRLSWTTARGIDTKTVERAEKNEGEKGVSLQAVDDIAKGLSLWPWQLLVPGLDLKRPPRLATDVLPEPTIEQAMAIVRAKLTEATGDESARLGDALRLLALTPDSDRAFKNAIAALNQTVGEELPPESGAADQLAHSTSPPPAHTSLVSSQVLGGGNQPDGGEEWTHKGRRIGPNIRPIKRTTGPTQKGGKEQSR